MTAWARISGDATGWRAAYQRTYRHSAQKVGPCATYDRLLAALRIRADLDGAEDMIVVADRCPPGTFKTGQTVEHWVAR